MTRVRSTNYIHHKEHSAMMTRAKVDITCGARKLFDKCHRIRRVEKWNIVPKCNGRNKK